jgi:hypothetical protein
MFKKKKLLITTALSGLMVSGALAQQSTPPAGAQPSQPSAADKQSQPGAMQNQNQSGSSMQSQTQKSPPATTAATTPGKESPKFVQSQSPDQFLASKFNGMDVVGADNKKIGDVNDILFAKEGKIEAFVVGVGGFLGIGRKDVALAPSAFEFTKDDNENKLKLSMTKEQLEQAPNFEPYQEPRPATTGAGPGGTSKPASAPRAPAPTPNR